MSTSPSAGDGRPAGTTFPFRRVSASLRTRVPPPRRDRDSCPGSAGPDWLERRLLQPPASLAGLPGLGIAVRYQAAGHGTGAGGDWYLATLLTDGRILVAVGDVAGHGRGVITSMLRLYHGLAALAMTGATPDRLLTWLNDLVQAAGLEHTASALAGYFCPATMTLSWAQAGHPPPVLIRGGSLLPLPRPAGVLLGAPCAGYETSTTPLRAGDLVLLHTDGLLERRDEALEARTATALGAARGHDDPDAAAAAVMSAAGANPADDTCLMVLQVRSWT